MTDYKHRDPRYVCAPWWRRLAFRWFGWGLPRVGLHYGDSARDKRDQAWVRQWQGKQ